MGDLVAKIGFSSLLHFSKNHGANFLSSLGRMKIRIRIGKAYKGPYKVTKLSLVLDRNSGFAILLGNFERPMFGIALHISIVDLTTDETLCVKDSV